MSKRTAEPWHGGLKDTEEGRRTLDRERVWVEATESLCRLMQARDVTRAELARRLGISRASVTQMLSGERNLTLGTLAEAFHVLGRSLRVTHVPPTDRVHVQGAVALKSATAAPLSRPRRAAGRAKR